MGGIDFYGNLVYSQGAKLPVELMYCRKVLARLSLRSS